MHTHSYINAGSKCTLAWFHQTNFSGLSELEVKEKWCAMFTLTVGLLSVLLSRMLHAIGFGWTTMVQNSNRTLEDTTKRRSAVYYANQMLSQYLWVNYTDTGFVAKISQSAMNFWCLGFMWQSGTQSKSHREHDCAGHSNVWRVLASLVTKGLQLRASDIFSGLSRAVDFQVFDVGSICNVWVINAV